MRRDAREIAFQLIFQRLFTTQTEFDETVTSALKKEADLSFANEIISSFDAHRTEMDATLTEHLIGYELARVYRVDLALLYLAMTEIYYLDTPAQVVINETLEIAKKYSTEKSAKFINGVLSSVVKSKGFKC